MRIVENKTIIQKLNIRCDPLTTIRKQSVSKCSLQELQTRYKVLDAIVKWDDKAKIIIDDGFHVRECQIVPA